MKVYLKYLIFAALSLLFIVLLRPDLFIGRPIETEISDETDSKGNRGKTLYNDYQDPRRPILIKKDAQLPNERTEYAEGYSERDFGDAFREPEEMFKITSEELQSPGGLWDILLKLRFEVSYDHATDMVVQRPKFKDEHLKLDNQKIEIEGFIVPFDIVHEATGGKHDGTMFMLSAFPAASCFFCKGAGPESIIEVYPKKPIPYSKESVKIKGRLELNDMDYLRMAYILREAELVK